MMKRAALLVCCLAILGVGATAQDDGAAFKPLMERGNQAMGMLGISLKEKDAAGSVDAAKQAAAAFADIYAFFEKRKTADAMQFAKGVQEGFTQAGDLAAAGKLDEALAKFQATRTHCDGCHQAHRTRNTDGSYSMK
jgi:hypothetical protein